MDNIDHMFETKRYAMVRATSTSKDLARRYVAPWTSILQAVKYKISNIWDKYKAQKNIFLNKSFLILQFKRAYIN